MRVTAKIDVVVKNLDNWYGLYRNNDGLVAFNGHENYKKGINTFTFSMPAKSFIPGTYMIKMGASVKNTEYILNPANSEVISYFAILSSDKPLFSCI